ncbi:cold shock domain-containing protein [Streptomyces sp. NPDC098781]|uniref:cold shock domain-containing protein n=1 Tax=Streptomyces sp. NPDC098781 TaxID=3366097 RepID=UPI0037F28FFC
MRVIGILREWHGDEGWGVIESDTTPGGCWAHFGSVLRGGYRSLSSGQTVSFTFERGRQDGYDYRATAVWTADERPEEPAAPAAPAAQQPSAAYRSTLHLEFDAPAGGAEADRPD